MAFLRSPGVGIPPRPAVLRHKALHSAVAYGHILPTPARVDGARCNTRVSTSNRSPFAVFGFAEPRVKRGRFIAAPAAAILYRTSRDTAPRAIPSHGTDPMRRLPARDLPGVREWTGRIDPIRPAGRLS